MSQQELILSITSTTSTCVVWQHQETCQDQFCTYSQGPCPRELPLIVPLQLLVHVSPRIVDVMQLNQLYPVLIIVVVPSSLLIVTACNARLLMIHFCG